jgi:hypothetical protein
MTNKARDIILRKPLRMKEIISMEIMLRASAAHLNITQVPIKHIKRKFGQSRGLPLKKIPKVINMALRNFPLLKKDLVSFKTI